MERRVRRPRCRSTTSPTNLPMLERADEWLQLITDFLGKHDA
ncbi:hypothetical protein [Streptomyces sp. NPDC051677]